MISKFSIFFYLVFFTLNSFAKGAPEDDKRVKEMIGKEYQSPIYTKYLLLKCPSDIAFLCKESTAIDSEYNLTASCDKIVPSTYFIIDFKNETYQRCLTAKKDCVGQQKIKFTKKDYGDPATSVVLYLLDNGAFFKITNDASLFIDVSMRVNDLVINRGICRPIK